MTRRPTNTLSSSQTQKWTRNGISSSCADIDLLEPPPDTTWGMRVWHGNAKKPGVIHKSVIPLPSDRITAQQEVLALEQDSDALVVVTTGQKPRKRAKWK